MRASNPLNIPPRIIACLLLATVAVGATACSEDPVAPTCALKLGEEYDGANTSLDMILDHNCENGNVTGTLYDANSFAYDLEGSISGNMFTFSATRDRPSGNGVDTYRSSSSLEVLSGGQILRGRITKNSIGPNEALQFVLVTD